MIPTVRDIEDLLEEMAPCRLAEQWDNPGLQVGSGFQKVKKICVALDATLEALESASDKDAQMLFTHHPLIFTPLQRVEGGAYPGNVIFQAIRTGISVMAAHTNLDAARGGINDILADLLSLQEVEVLKEREEEEGVGLGRIGYLREAMPLSEFSREVKKVLEAESIRVIGEGKSSIRRVAVVGGSGGSLISLSRQKGADLLLTGDIGHHHALEAGTIGLALIDGGHFHTERVAFKVFAGHLRDALRSRGWEVEVELYEAETDPLDQC